MSSQLIRKTRWLLLRVIIVSIGFWTIPVQAQVSDAQVGALVEALRLAAPQTGTENDGLYSEWQIKPENIPRWSQQCIDKQLTPTEFESSPVTARAILVCVMREVLEQQYLASSNNESIAVQRAAAWWMTGDANSYNSHPANSFTHSYIQKVLNLYQEQKGNAQTQPTPTPAPQPTVTPPQPVPSSPAQPTPQTSATTQITDAQVGTLVEALRLAAPQTGTENNGLYSDWRIKPEKISLWSQRCMGREVTPEDFAANPATARTILLCVMGDVFRQQYSVSGNNEVVAVQRTAAWWLIGDPEQYNSDATAAYTQRVLDLYKK